MKDKHWGILGLTIICSLCISFDIAYAKEVVLMSIPVIAAVIRD